MTEQKRIKITYSTLATPDPELDRRYDEAVVNVRANADKRYASLFINGEQRGSDKTFTKTSPIDGAIVLGRFAEGSAADVNEAVAAARAAYPGWKATPYQDRIALLRQAADLISDRVFVMGAVLSLEVGKNRLEALGDIEETADLIRYACDTMEANNGFAAALKQETDRHHNFSVLRPHGVWGVISPFNFPAALSGGPVGAALVTGNTVVLKPAPDGPLTNYLLMLCLRDAGFPAGVFNMVTGGDAAGRALTANADVNGITFTGSYDVGMSIMRDFAVGGRFVRPVIAEMGGKNPTIITPKADLDKAALGVMRSAFGLTGQKCSACSRVFVHNSVKSAFLDKLVKLTKEKVTVGDPTKKENYMGPIINKAAYEAYQAYSAQVRADGNVLTGAETLELGNGFYVAPTIVADLPADHPLWQHEMFAPIVFVDGYDSPEEAMTRANEVELGLTAGLYSEDEADVNWFLNNIEAGVLYINRDTGATTGAWPGYQSFGGWKGSTGTNKAAGSLYYLQQYMREQSHTIVDF